MCKLAITLGKFYLNGDWIPPFELGGGWPDPISMSREKTLAEPAAHGRFLLTVIVEMDTVFDMSTQQLTTEAMALPLAERVMLAQTLWESIHAEHVVTDEPDAVKEAIRRDQELSSGAVTGRTHEEVMQAARRAIKCT